MGTAGLGLAGLATAEIGTGSDMRQMGDNRSSQASVSAVLATINGLSAEPLPAASFPSLSGGDAKHSVAEMAQRDLDAALQLLAERAQYITGADGAAIALRRASYNDMLCRASTGPNAPELGALLSAEFGLSGESVRTRLPLRCDDAERDARVNRAGCRLLGIASVAVMPIVSDDQVLGVFELFSGKVGAFAERDLSVLQRLGEMVETAVRLAQTAQATEFIGEFVTEVNDVAEVVHVETALESEGATQVATQVAAAAAAATEAAAPVPESRVEVTAKVSPSVTLPKPVAAEPAASIPVKKPLLWSAAPQPAPKPVESDQSHVPPVLRNLRKCQACGFPVSESRTLCIDCEEKQWRGQLRVPAAPQASAVDTPAAAAISSPSTLSEAPASKGDAEPGTGRHPVQSPPLALKTAALSANSSSLKEASVTVSTLPEAAEISASTLPFLSAGGTSSESWFSANKYILGAITLVVVALAIIAALR